MPKKDWDDDLYNIPPVPEGWDPEEDSPLFIEMGTRSTELDSYEDLRKIEEDEKREDYEQQEAVRLLQIVENLKRGNDPVFAGINIGALAGLGALGMLGREENIPHRRVFELIHGQFKFSQPKLRAIKGLADREMNARDPHWPLAVMKWSLIFAALETTAAESEFQQRDQQSKSLLGQLLGALGPGGGRT